MNQINPWISSIKAAKQLFISGRHLTKTAQLVRPHIQFDISDDAIAHNIRLRAWPDPPVSISTLRSKFIQWQRLSKSSASCDTDSKKDMWDIEEDVLPLILAIPNDLSDATPATDSLVFSHEAKELPRRIHSSTKDEISYEDQVAKLELQIQSELSSTFVAKEGFYPLLAPDFIKSPLNMHLTSQRPMELYGLKGMFLSGGASLQSLLAFFIKNELQSSSDINVIAFGRAYDGSNPCLPQRILASTLLLSRSEQEAQSSRDKVVESLKKYFAQSHGLSFDIVFKGAPSLSSYESHSLLFKSKKDGSIISEISSFGDYLSKRLSIIYNDGRHCFLTGGTLCDVTSLINSHY